MLQILRLILAGFTVVALQQPASPVFRSRAEAVVIDASVMQGGQVVSGLRPEDFEVRDNGVVQQIVDFDRAMLPLDVTLTIDISGSMTPAKRQIVRRAVEQVNSALEPSDRVRIVTFGSHIAERVALQPPPVAFMLPDVDSGTSLLDTVLFSLVTPPVEGRRQLCLVMTDGNDTTSFFDAATVIDTLKYATNQMSFVLTRSPEPSDRSFAAIRERRRRIVATMNTAAEWTGGRLVELERDDRLGEAFLSVIHGLRSSYVLRYSPEPRGVAGWHDVRVTVKGRQYSVRAKRGYWADDRR